MKMKAKTYGIKILVTSCLQLKMFNHNNLQLKFLSNMFCLSFSS